MISTFSSLIYRKPVEDYSQCHVSILILLIDFKCTTDSRYAKVIYLLRKHRKGIASCKILLVNRTRLDIFPVAEAST